jgi:hypothetical protein
MAIKYFKWPQNRPNGNKIYQHFPLEDPPKFPKIGIFGLKTNNLATMILLAILFIAYLVFIERETLKAQSLPAYLC